MYEILEFTHRYDLTIKHVRGDIDKTILDNFEELKAKFERTWGKHHCEEEGCGRVLTLDGNLKLTRRMCAAKTAGVKKFDHSSGYVLTGCRETPPIGKKFCSLHAEGNTPSIPAEKLTQTSLKTLKESLNRKRQERIYEDIFNIEGIHGRKRHKNKTQYYISWLGYSEKTWEFSENIPKIYRDFYDKSGKKEIKIPEPRIRHVKNSGKDRYALLRWENYDADDEYVNVKDLILPDHDEQEEESCNTKKHLGRRYYRRTAGLMVGAWPCGVVPFVEELYGSESLTQVHGHLCNFLDSGKEILDKLETIFYDDACHMWKFMTKKERMAYSEAATRLGKLEMMVDFFHIKNHTDKFCHENLNPYTIKEHLKDINSNICEQTFSWLNRFMQTKPMNRARHLWFFIYLLDRHNLKKEGRLDETHPRYQHIESDRTSDVNCNTTEESEQTSVGLQPKGEQEESNNNAVGTMKQKITDYFCQEKRLNQDQKKPREKETFYCSECPISTIKTQAGLKKHLLLIHKIDSEAHLKKFECEKCGKMFKQKNYLTRHSKNTNCAKSK